MPEVTGQAEIKLSFTDEDLLEMIKTKFGDRAVKLSNSAWANRNKYGEIEVESEEEVTLEFELSDYAQERDEP
jgi:hypothetical protein